MNIKAAQSVTFDIFEFFYFLFKSFVKVELSYVFIRLNKDINDKKKVMFSQ